MDCTEEAQKNENNPVKIQIKPNVYFWRNIQIADAHLSNYNYKREYDSIGNYIWSTSSSGINGGCGANEWSRSNGKINYISSGNTIVVRLYNEEIQ